MPKVILIQPTQYGTNTGKPLKQNRIYLPGLALPLLASLTPKHWDVKIIIEVVDKIDFDEEADLIGIGTMGVATFRAMDIALEFKKRGRTVFMGGYMVSILPQYVRDYCDSVVIGDGELSYPQLLNDFERTGTLKPIYDHQLENLNNLPLPRYDLILKKKIGYMLPIQAGRGCPHTCSFCSIACVYKGKYLTRPVDDVMRDILHIKKLGYKRFFLIDDNIASNPKFLFELASKIKPLKMKWASQCSLLIAKNDSLLKAVADSGCSVLSLGVESLSQESLDSINKSWVKAPKIAQSLKKIQDAGIAPATEMVVGTDHDTPESIKATADFIIKYKIPIPKFYILTPLPNSDFYKEMKLKNRLLHEDYSKYTTSLCVFKPVHFSPEQLDRSFMALYKKVYSYKNIFYRTILNKGILRNPKVYFFAFFSNLVYRKYINQGDAPNIL